MTGAAKTLICLILAAPTLGQAQIVMCTDERGRTYTSDRPIPECQGRAMRHYGKSGTVVREIPAPPTAEERRQQQLEAEQKRQLQEARKEQQRQDRALLATYRSEDAITEARERAAGPIYEMIKYEKEALAKAQERRDLALARWNRARESNDPNAAEWKRRADAAEGTVNLSKTKLQGYQEELAQLQNGYDAKLRRYRELKRSADTLARQP
jgi:hypothetical protein